MSNDRLIEVHSAEVRGCFRVAANVVRENDGTLPRVRTLLRLLEAGHITQVEYEATRALPYPKPTAPPIPAATLAAAETLLTAMSSAPPEVIEAIQRRLGPCDGALLVAEALLALREWREANARGSW